jgi:tetratricopeptide (TPR) repeat protein
MQAEPPSVRTAVPGLPSVIVQVLEKALAKKPTDRFQDAGEFRTVLESAREAIASGRGEEPLAGAQKAAGAGAAAPAPAPKSAVTQPIDRVTPSAADLPPTPSPASSSRRPERPASGARSRSVAPPPETAGPGPLIWISGAVLVLAVVVGVILLRRPAATAPPSAPAQSGQVSTLAKELADTEVRNARKKLEARDYADAASRAERALKFDANNAEAKDVLGQARKVQEQIASAVNDARSAADPAKKADAFWTLLDLAPDNPAAAEIAPSLDAGFKSRADESKTQMAEAQRAAEKAQATRLDGFRDGLSISRDAETSYKARAYARAARDYMRARDRFRRVLR